MLALEPAADIRAQWAALLDPSHPKAAMFVIHGNALPIAIPADFHVIFRREGTLITRDHARAFAFWCGQTSEADMARFLDYPEHKDDMVKLCAADPSLARMVQARDTDGNVITEAAASPIGLKHTIDALSAHVPLGGDLVVMPLIEAIARRMARRRAERMN